MLRPTKHAHPDRTIISVSLLLLSRVKKDRLYSYDKLKSYAKDAVDGGDVLYKPALSFLFLLGLVEYHPKTDSLEYVGEDETIKTIH